MLEPTEPLRFSYDPMTDVLEVEGIKYHGGLFRALAVLPPGEIFMIQGRSDGALLLHNFGPHPMFPTQ